MSTATIVVGIDGSPASHSALRMAIDEAALRRSRVMVVTCWSSDARHLTHGPATHEADTFDRARTVALQALASVDATDVERTHIVTSTAEGQPGHELVHASRCSELLVIGSTTRGGLARRSGKTVVDYCLRFSDVPVLVVPYAPVTLDQVDIDRELRGGRSDEGADIPVRYGPSQLT
ncbi:MAG: universal stress protein [Aeromicrobium sp.]